MDESQNIISAFFATAAKMGEGPCAHYKRAGAWKALSWSQMAGAVLRLAGHLKGLGIAPGDRVAIISATRIEWTIADCAILAAGAAAVPIYPSLTPESIGNILRDSTPKLAFAENAAIADKLRRATARADIPIISFDVPESEKLIFGGTEAKVESEFGEFARGIAWDDVATIVYTSGTTGEQKGAVLTHGNIFAEVRAAQEIFDFRPGEVGLVCLPLAHVLGRLMQFYQLVQGSQAAYAESIEKLGDNFREVRPHFVCGVPRMLEKIYETITLKVERSSEFKKKLFRASVKIGLARGALVGRRRPIPFILHLKWIFADILVFRKIRQVLGGRLKIFISGGAALKEEIAKFFHATGLLVIEGYGLTETFAAATANRLDDYRFGTVGKPLPGVQLKIAEDGEILFRGPTVFKGYLNLPKDSSEAFDPDGWFKTGDLGEFTRDGFLRITGRKKEIIVTAAGKNIAPQMIEAVMGGSPYINYFMVYGEGKKYLVGLVALNTQAAEEYLRQKGEARGEGTIANHPAVHSLIEGHIRERNLALAPFETIKRFAIVEGDFSTAGGELTPTLKVRRKFTGEKYREMLEALYNE